MRNDRLELTLDEFTGYCRTLPVRIHAEVLLTWGELVARNYTPGHAAYLCMEAVELVRAEHSAKH